MSQIDTDYIEILKEESKPRDHPIEFKPVRRIRFLVFPKQLRELWQYRELAIELFWTHLKLRYVGSVLGFIWTMLNPMLYIATYWFVFSYIVRMGLPNYPLFLIPGFLAWNFTFGALVSASESILQSKYLITKIAFPSEILPLTSVAVCLFDFLVSLAIYLLAVVILPPAVPIQIIALPLVIIMQILITIGISMLVACSSVFFRDIPKLVQVLGTLLFFLTPIFYPLSFIPEAWQPLVRLNPMTQIITFYHAILYEWVWPEPAAVAMSFLIALSLFVFGFWVFNRFKYKFAELS